MSLTARLSRMAHSYRANISSVSTLDGRGADTAIRKKKKKVRTDPHVDPNNNRTWLQRATNLWEVIIIINGKEKETNK